MKDHFLIYIYILFYLNSTLWFLGIHPETPIQSTAVKCVEWMSTSMCLCVMFTQHPPLCLMKPKHNTKVQCRLNTSIWPNQKQISSYFNNPNMIIISALIFLILQIFKYLLLYSTLNSKTFLVGRLLQINVTKTFWRFWHQGTHWSRRNLCHAHFHSFPAL